MGRIEKGIMTPISDNTFIFSLQLLNIITTAYGEWYGEVWLFSMHIIAQKERGAFRGGESSTNPKKKKKSIKQLLVFVLISRGLILLLYGYAYDMTVDHAIGAYICTFCLFDYPISW